jgi:hypothetical protein
MFDRLIWQSDRMILDDLVFRLEHFRNDESWELGDECARFYKTKGLVDDYARFWKPRNFAANRVLELGIWKGGSVMFWFEYFQPRRHVAVDLMRWEDSAYFRRWVQSRRLEDRVRTYWGVDQADAGSLREIVRREFGGSLDLVIDDASHLYGSTKSSFETLFPLLRSGGLYVIEDWAWEHWPDYQAPDHAWASQRAPTELIFELVQAAGTNNGLIRDLSINKAFAVVERGWIREAELENFKLEEHISTRTHRAHATSR